MIERHVSITGIINDEACDFPLLVPVLWRTFLSSPRRVEHLSLVELDHIVGRRRCGMGREIGKICCQNWGREDNLLFGNERYPPKCKKSPPEKASELSIGKDRISNHHFSGANCLLNFSFFFRFKCSLTVVVFWNNFLWGEVIDQTCSGNPFKILILCLFPRLWNIKLKIFYLLQSLTEARCRRCIYQKATSTCPILMVLPAHTNLVRPPR